LGKLSVLGPLVLTRIPICAVRQQGFNSLPRKGRVTPATGCFPRNPQLSCSAPASGEIRDQMQCPPIAKRSDRLERRSRKRNARRMPCSAAGGRWDGGLSPAIESRAGAARPDLADTGMAAQERTEPKTRRSSLSSVRPDWTRASYLWSAC
jgi:hypothetical protein